MPPDEPGQTQPNPAKRSLREQAIENKLAYERYTLRDQILRTFPRSFRGYDPGAVERHLELIVGWLSLSGIDRLVHERLNEQDPVVRQLRVQAETEAERVRDDARREADRLIQEARDEAQRVLETAQQEAQQVWLRARSEAGSLLADARADAAKGRYGALTRLARRGQRG